MSSGAVDLDPVTNPPVAEGANSSSSAPKSSDVVMFSGDNALDGAAELGSSGHGNIPGETFLGARLGDGEDDGPAIVPKEKAAKAKAAKAKAKANKVGTGVEMADANQLSLDGVAELGNVIADVAGTTSNENGKRPVLREDAKARKNSKMQVMKSDPAGGAKKADSKMLDVAETLDLEDDFLADEDSKEKSTKSKSSKATRKNSGAPKLFAIAFRFS
eukprot:g19867.t1